MPTPTKPHQLKVISGSKRLSHAETGVQLPVVASVPAPPDWLINSYAVKEWERLAPILVANKLLTVASESALAHLCAICGHLSKSWTAGLTPMPALLGQYRVLANDFGLTPAMRGKVQPPNRSPNPFAQSGKRPNP